jgi:membrane fusion protein (multidrug efflux system)
LVEPTVPPKEAPASPPAGAPLWRRTAPTGLAILLAAALIIIVPLRWNGWIAGSRWQETDDATLRGDITPLSARIGGYVREVPVRDFALVHAGQLLVQIEDNDYRAEVAQALADMQGAEAALANNLAQQKLQSATVAAADAQVVANNADLVRAQLEARRQHTLGVTEAASRQEIETADATLGRGSAVVRQAQAQADAQRLQIGVLQTQALQLAATLEARRAALQLARINLGYTRIIAPANGLIGERQVRPGQLVSPGTQVMTVTPSNDVWVVANFKETQLALMRVGQRATISVDALPGRHWKGRVQAIAPASGSQFALLPPDNASGNYTKVVQRVPVKITLDAENTDFELLRPGLSVIAEVDTSSEPRAR